LLTPYILIHKVLIPGQCFQIHIAYFSFHCHQGSIIKCKLHQCSVLNNCMACFWHLSLVQLKNIVICLTGSAIA